jgi:hypothetical protein
MKTEIKQYEQAREQAAEQLEQLRSEAHAAAVAARDALQDAVSAATQRKKLIGIITAAIDDAGEAACIGAPAIVMHFTAGIWHHKVKAGDGAILLDVFTDAAKGLNDEQRRAALQAVLLMATGRATAGLFHFPQPWGDAVSLPTIYQFAGILAGPELIRYQASLAEQQHDHAAAAAQAERLAAPVAITPTTRTPTAEAAELIEVVNHNEGTPLSIAGIRFPGYGKTTRITADDFERVQDSPLWKCGIHTDMLKVRHGR